MKGILVVSFGTSYPDILKSCIESTENFIRNEFKDYEVRRAFTSGMIMKKILKRDGVKTDNTEEALEKMYNEGFTEVLVQPTHIMFGDEFDKVKEAVKKHEHKFQHMALGRPLLYVKEDYFDTARAMMPHMPELGENHALVLMAHGTTNPANAAYLNMEYVLKREAGENIFVGTVEGYPELDDVIFQLKRKNIKKVTLMPFMLVAGDHAMNDMAGDEEDSWKNVLASEGFEVDCILEGLGEHVEIQKIYAEHLRDCKR